MQHHLSRRFATRHRHCQGGMHQFLLHAVMHVPAHYRPGIQVEHYHQIQPPLTSPDIGHIRHPVLIDVASSELSLQQIGRHG